MWLVIFGSVIVGAIICILYLINRFAKIDLIKKISKGKKILSLLTATGALLIIGILLTLTLNLMNTIIVLLHLAVFWLLCDLTALIIKKFTKKEFKRHYNAIAAILITTLYLSIGGYMAHHVFTENYTIDTDKNVSALRIVQFADSHIGTTFNADKFSEHIKKIQSENPDVVLITGDFVDDNTSREDMLDACNALSQLDTKYGIYFSYGNHDRGYYSAGKRGWTAQELENALEKNGVTILEDESVPIGENYCIIGRRDLSYSERLSMQELTKQIDKNKFNIVLDHQPSDYDAQADSGVDLVLSGHTHGGQLIPITYVGEWIGANCRTYGYEKRDNTNFIVTSGISDWAIKFKTGCKSEYVVIDVK